MDPWSFYLTTIVDVRLPDGVIEVEQTDEPVTDSFPFEGHEAWIITACNPRSVPLLEAENASRHASLGLRLAELKATAFESEGRDPHDGSWSEIGYCVLGLNFATIHALAEEFDQNAVYRWTPDVFETIGVVMPGHSARGWKLR